ncbi:MAG: DUF2310 family Zn-ribbon-containing protein [Prosthecobacter sp.]
MKSHILAQLTFGPWRDDADEEWENSVEHTLVWFLGHLLRCSQIIGDPVYGIIEGVVQAQVRLPHLDALDAHHMSSCGRADLEKLECLLGCRMEIRLLASGCGVQDQTDWKQATWLVLYGASLQGLAPVRDQNLACIPSYLLPMDELQKEKLFFWACDEDCHSRLWFSSGSLEKETYVAMADPRSALNVRARELAAMVEKATGKPTYTYLFRHYSLPGDSELTRPCPLCGGAWKVEEAVEFRCEPCRLTSSSAADLGEEELARIGTWQG